MNYYYLLIPILLVLPACGGPKATYIQGGKGSSVQVEASMTGGHIILTGPFVYCSDRPGDKGMETKFCTVQDMEMKDQ